MSGPSPLLKRGRGVVFLLAGALLISFVASWLRQLVLPEVGIGVLQSIPWPLLRRPLLGFLVDLPLGLVTAAVGAVAGRLIVLEPWRTALSLVAAVWLLDLATAWLVVHDLPLWTDPWVLAARLVTAATTALVIARSLGWRPARGKPKASSGSV